MARRRPVSHLEFPPQLPDNLGAPRSSYSEARTRSGSGPGGFRSYTHSRSHHGHLQFWKDRETTTYIFKISSTRRCLFTIPEALLRIKLEPRCPFTAAVKATPSSCLRSPVGTPIGEGNSLRPPHLNATLREKLSCHCYSGPLHAPGRLTDSGNRKEYFLIKYPFFSPTQVTCIFGRKKKCLFFFFRCK